MKTICSQRESQGIERESWLKPHPTFRIRKILVPVDFSEPSQKALQYALCMVQEFGAELILLHVVEQYPLIPEMPAISADMQDLLKKEGADKLEKWRESIEGAVCISVLRVGKPAQAIVAEATAEQTDLIIIGMHGRSGLGRLFLGSVAERVVQTAPCPVLTVRDRQSSFLNEYADDASIQRFGPEAQPQVQKLQTVET